MTNRLFCQDEVVLIAPDAPTDMRGRAGKFDGDGGPGFAWVRVLNARGWLGLTTLSIAYVPLRQIYKRIWPRE